MKANNKLRQTIKDEYAIGLGCDSFENYRQDRGIDELDLDVIVETYYRIRLKEELPNEEDISNNICNMLRFMHLNEVERDNKAFDNDYIINRYSEEWSIAMENAKWILTQLT